jgi:uncharacterized protein YjbI with pentapeptide repeats
LICNTTVRVYGAHCPHAPDTRIAIKLEPFFEGGGRVILQTDRPQTLIPNLPSLEAVLIMESRPSRHSGSSLSGSGLSGSGLSGSGLSGSSLSGSVMSGSVMWTQMYQAGNFHLNLNFQSTPTGGTLHGQVISLNRLKLEHNRITALNVIGTARLETEFGQLEAKAGINANGDFEIVLEQPAFYPLTLRLLSQHGVDLSVSDLCLY